MTEMKREKLRKAAYIAADGVSALSGTPLEGKFHLDRKVPGAAGGTYEPGNVQVLTPEENLLKSSACPPALRLWQEEFLDKWKAMTATDFTLVALPGSGKTVAALSVAQRWIEENPRRRRVIVVVPTDPLRTQWQEEAAKLFNLQFHTRDFYTFKEKYHGGIVTYQLVASDPLTFRMLCVNSEVLVICDEIHHAGDNEWGAALREAITPAKRRLLMSGTPFRSDGKRIPFVSYDENGKSIADFPYDYDDAIKDGVIRVVRFEHDTGIVRRSSSAGIETLELCSDDESTDDDAALRGLLQPGHFTETLMRKGYAKLLEIRQTMPRFKMMVAAIDQIHAEQLARQLKPIIGEAPALIVSDDARATSSVQAFRESDQMAAVVVKKFSEGVDIPPLIVLVYLTVTRTELAFRQLVGRVVRNMGTEEDSEAFVYMPDHPVLVRWALNIMKAQTDSFLNESVEERDACERSGNSSLLEWPTVLETEHTGSAGCIIEGDRVTPDDATWLQQTSREEHVTQALLLKVWRRAKARAEASQPLGPPQGGIRSPMKPLEIREKEWQNKVEKECRKAAFRLQLLSRDPQGKPPFKYVGNLVNNYIGKERTAFTQEDSLRAIEHVKKLGRPA